jgi:hypothetical protein
MTVPPDSPPDKNRQNDLEARFLLCSTCISKTTSALRPPSLNLDCCSGVETGSGLNGPGDITGLHGHNDVTAVTDNASQPAAPLVAMNIIHAHRNNKAATVAAAEQPAQIEGYNNATPALTQVSSAESSSVSGPMPIYIGGESDETLSKFLSLTPDLGYGRIVDRHPASFDSLDENCSYALRCYLSDTTRLESSYPCPRGERWVVGEYDEQYMGAGSDVDVSFAVYHGDAWDGGYAGIDAVVGAGRGFLLLSPDMGPYCSVGSSINGNGQSCGSSSNGSSRLGTSFGTLVAGIGAWMEAGGVYDGPLLVDDDDDDHAMSGKFGV